MLSFEFTLTTSARMLIDFNAFVGMRYWNIQISNADGPDLEFFWGDPAIGARTAFLVPSGLLDAKDNYPLVGKLFGRVRTPVNPIGPGTATITVTFW